MAGLSEEEDMQGSSCRMMERGHRSLLDNQNAFGSPRIDRTYRGDLVMFQLYREASCC